MRDLLAVHLFAVGLLLAALGCVGGASVLPRGADLGSFGDVGKPEAYTGPGLYAYMDGGADVFFEYGYVAAWVRRYQKDGRELIAEVFEMKDAAAAAGLYSYMRRSGTEREITPGCSGSLTDVQALLAKGRFFLVCRNADPMVTDGAPVRELCARIAGRFEGACDKERFLGALPEEGRAPGSEVLLSGPVGLNIRPWLACLDRTGFARGWMSDYQSALGSAEALLAEYRSATEAENAARNFEACRLPDCVVICRDARIAIARGRRADNDELPRLAERLLSFESR